MPNRTGTYTARILLLISVLLTVCALVSCKNTMLAQAFGDDLSKGGGGDAAAALLYPAPRRTVYLLGDSFKKERDLKLFIVNTAAGSSKEVPVRDAVITVDGAALGDTVPLNVKKNYKIEASYQGKTAAYTVRATDDPSEVTDSGDDYIDGGGGIDIIINW